VIPTPAVAYLTLREKAQAGAVISASHNPGADNGSKFFSEVGAKIAPAIEEQI
jgi:phosphoglucosamine mutase